MIVEAAIVAQILGARMPASNVHVPLVKTPSYHSVQIYDNLINLTNRVLDRSIRADVVRIQTNKQNGLIAEVAARRNQQAVEEHCRQRLHSDKLDPTECGHGFGSTR